jgi:hypothetical protein
MRGLEYGIILGIIIVVAIIVIIFIIVINPAIIFGKSTQSGIDFREACLFWSLNGYKDTSFTYEGNEVDMSGFCAEQLGLLIMSNEADWENCRDLCRARS